MYRVRVLLVLFTVFAGLTSLLLAAEHTTDSVETVKKNLVANKGVLIDVREMNEWRDGHLQDAKNLPLSKLKVGVPAEDFAKLAPKGTIVYLHCAVGVRALKAADILKGSGYDVRALRQGYNELLQAGFSKAE